MTKNAETLELSATRYDLMAAAARDPNGSFATARREMATAIRSIIPHLNETVDLSTNRHVVCRVPGFAWAGRTHYFDCCSDDDLRAQIAELRAKLVEMGRG